MAPRTPTARRAPRSVAVVVLAAALLASSALPAIAASVEERRLRQTQGQLTEVRQRIEAVSGERAEHAAELADVEQELTAALEAVHQAELAVQRQQEAVEAARRELRRLEEGARAHRQVMAGRAAELYRRGTTSTWAALFAAGDAEDALARSAYVEVVARADRGVFEQGEIDQVRLAAQRATLEAEEEVLQRVLAQQQLISEEVAAIRELRAQELAEVEGRLASLRSQEQHLESERRELAALSRRAEQSRQAATRSRQRQTAAAPAPSGGSAGGWRWPASGPVTSGYGMRWGRMHEGIDIGARHGAPVVAARAGRVTFAGRMGGYGNLVLVNHGGGIVTAYAHLSSFSVSAGQQVGSGQRLGAVGCTGSCTGPHLHFEIRVSGSARNPRAYLP